MKISSLVAILLLIIASFLHVTVQQQSQLDCSSKLDIFFLLDASASLTDADFEKEKKLVIDLLQSLIDDSRDVKAGYLTFTESVNNVRTLLSNLRIVQFELANVIFDQEGTNLLVPLDYAYNNIFTSNPDLRPGSHKILFQITDGRDQFSNISQLRSTSKLLSAENVTTVAIGVGNLIDTDQLRAIATEPHEQNLIVFSDLNEAIGNISKIIDRTCTIPRVIVISALVQSSTSITVKWMSYTVVTVSSYKICLKTEIGSGVDCIRDINSTQTELLVENLIPNTRYEISVFAFTSIGVTPMSNILVATTSETPGTPLQLNATSLTSTSIKVTWQAVTGSTITSYEICVSLSSGGNCILETIIGAAITSLEYTQGNLEPNTTYFFRIRAISSGGIGEYSIQSNATTALLGSPNLLSAVESSFHAIILTWSAYTDASLSSFEICVKLEGSTSCDQTFTAQGTATSYTVILLKAYTLYEVSLVAIKGSIRSAESNSITVRTGEKRPGDPTNVSAVALSPVEIEINWSSPASDELYGVIKAYYICVRGETGESCLFQINHNASITPFTVTLSGLNPDTVYRVRVRAINGGGAGSYSDDYSIMTESVSAVIVFTSTINSDSIIITWTGGNIPAAEISGAVITITTVSTGAVQIINLGQADAVNGSYQLGQLQPGTHYNITIVVSTSVGDTPLSNEISVLTQESLPTGVPIVTSTGGQTSTSITLTLDSIPMLQRNGVILFYIVYYKADGDNSYSSVVVPVTDRQATLTYTLDGLSPNTVYTIQVSGNNSVGEGPRTQSVSITTTVQGAVQNLTSTSTSRFINVSYSAYTEIGLIEYRVCLRTTSQGACNQTQNTTGLVFYFAGLEPAQTYYITVTAVTQFGDSEESQELNVTTDEEIPGPPNSLNVSLLTVESISITWTEISSDQQYGIIIEYIVCIKEVGSANCTFMQTVDANSQPFSLNQTGLMPNTNYIITVQGRNSAGLGDTVETTIQTEPLQGVVLSAQAVDGYRIRLTWSEPNVPMSLITGGILTSVGSPGDFGPSFDIGLSKAISRDFIAEGFYPAITYYFTLRIKTTLGLTPVSNEASTTTNETEPTGIPTNFSAETISASSIKVIWTPVSPELTNGVITMYTICFGTEIVTCSEVSVNASQPLEYTFIDLEPETEYLFRIRAHTAVGAGPYTDSINQTTSKPGGFLIRTITASSATTVDITWNQLNISVSYYEICVLMTETENCSNPIQINNEIQTSYTIVNLLPYTMYYVTISVMTPGGYVINSPQRSIRTQQQAPSSPPTNVTVTVDSDTIITIFFGTVAERDTNGVITVYEVCVQTVSGGPCVFTVNLTASETRVNFTGLTDNTNYIVTVRAYTSAGPGPYSPEVAITTLHSIPDEAVINVTVQSGPTVIINGSIPQTGGPTTGVQVCVRLQSTTECVYIIVLNTTDTSFNTTIEDLDPNQTYEIVVTLTGPGGNTTTGPVTITTQPEPPSSPPTNVTVTVDSDTIITIFFGTVAERDTNGVITVYEVCVQTVSGGPCVFTVNLTTPETRVNITGLTDNTNYIVTVRAYTSAGPGPYSPEVAITTLHSIPDEAVINVTVQSGPTVIINGSIPQTGGPTTGVQVCVRLQSTTECVYIIVLNTTDTSFNTTIEDLDPNQTYEIVVTLTGPGGNTTTGPVTITTQPEPPSSPPTNVTVTVDSDTIITIFFGTVAERDTNGVITVYEVCVQTVSGGPCVFTVNLTTPETRVNITGLTDNTNYIVTVRAYTSAGPGPYSPEVAITTLHSIPDEAVINVTVQSGPTVIINGSIPQTGGPTTGVQVCVRLQSTTECVYIIVLNTTDTSFNTTIEDLDPNQTYEIVVTLTGPGGNTTTGPVTITTQPEPPSSPPTNVTVTVDSDTIITIFFGTVAERDTNGVITVYEVCVQTVSGGPCVFTVNLTTPETRVNITGLTDNTNYIVTVRAYTSAGPGPYSPEVAITTLHSLPDEAVINVTVQSGPTVIINGSIPQTGGPTTGVQVCVRLQSTTECVYIIVLNTTDTSFNTTIEDLDPNQTYEIVVTLTGPGGNTTTGPVTITTQPELPSGTVQNIQTSSDSTVLRINWTQPIAINDVIVIYYVTVSTGGVILYITQTSNESIVFSGLNPNTEYEVVVTPSNSVGNGTSTTVIVRTQQEQPEPLLIVSVLTNSAQVMLTPVVNTSTTIQIKHYEICIQQSTSDTCDRTLIIAPTEDFNFTIQNLTANTLYRIMVFAITINDERGPPSDVVTFETFPLVPTEGITNLDAVINDLFSLEVSWDFNATSQEHEPTHFFVCLALESGGNCIVTINVTADINSVVLPKVEEKTMYYITVYPWNINGAGPTAVTNYTVPEKPAPTVTITATALSPYEIYSEWESHVIFLNISSFTICLSIKGSSVCNQTRYGQPVSRGELIFSGLTPNTSYTIHIVELISKTSDVITEARTLIIGTLDSPLNVLVTTISSTILRVTWVPSSQTQFGNLTSWEICYTAERFNETSGCTSSQKYQLYKSILNLEEHETYSITVRAVYTNGNGTAFSVPVRGKTEQDVPSRTISGLVGVTEVGESKFIWLAPPIKDQNGIIVYYLVVFEYEDDEGFKNISIREDPIMRETKIPDLVNVPYNISVTPYTIGAGPPYKIIGAVQEPVAGEALCPDWRIAVTILCVVLAVLIIMAIAMFSIILLLIVSKSSTQTYSAV